MGAEGTLDAVRGGVGPRGSRHVHTVSGAGGQPIEVAYGVLDGPDGQTAIIEVARIVGIADPVGMAAPVAARSTKGVGELLRALLDAGLRRFLVHPACLSFPIRVQHREAVARGALPALLGIRRGGRRGRHPTELSVPAPEEPEQVEEGSAEPAADTNVPETANKKKRKRVRSMQVAPHVERIVQTVALPPEERSCALCGDDRKVFGYFCSSCFPTICSDALCCRPACRIFKRGARAGSAAS
jgi:hypothetical protein